MSRRSLVLGVVIALYLCGLGFLRGVITERIRFDLLRSARLAELEAASSRVRARLMLLEHDSLRSEARQVGR